MRQLALGVRLPDRAVFATYLPGRNRQVLEHLQGLADGSVAGTAWIWGASGVGKTHLLQAVCVLASERVAAGYVPLRELGSLGGGAAEGLAGLGCVCLDDIDVVAGDAEWERVLFSLHRELDERGGRLVVAARSPPALIEWALPDLGSRLGASAVHRVKDLDDSELIQAVELRARVRGLELPAESARWLERRFPRNMRSLYALLDELDEAALEQRRRLTVPFLRAVLARRGFD